MCGPKDQRAYSVRVYKWIYSRDAECNCVYISK